MLVESGIIIILQNALEVICSGETLERREGKKRVQRAIE